MPPPGFTARPPARKLRRLGGCGGGRSPARWPTTVASLPSGKSRERNNQTLRRGEKRKEEREERAEIIKDKNNKGRKKENEQEKDGYRNIT